MKVLLVNGSAKAKGNTNAALEEVARQLEQEGIGAEIFQLGGSPIRDCIGCGQCTDKGCVFADVSVAGFVAAHPSGRILSFLDRAFYSGSRVFAYKPAASVVVARRGGCSASFDVLNKYFGIAQMPVAGSTYWNMVHGRVPGEAALDEEGMQTMRNLARNLAWMMKCFALGAEQGIPLPAAQREHITNFIR